MNAIAMELFKCLVGTQWGNLTYTQRVAVFMAIEEFKVLNSLAVVKLMNEPGFSIANTFISGREEMEAFCENLSQLSPKLGAYFKLKNFTEIDPVEASTLLELIGVKREEMRNPFLPQT